MNETIDEEKTVQAQVIGTSCGSTENPVVPAPLPGSGVSRSKVQEAKASAARAIRAKGFSVCVFISAKDRKIFSNIFLSFFLHIKKIVVPLQCTIKLIHTERGNRYPISGSKKQLVNAV